MYSLYGMYWLLPHRSNRVWQKEHRKAALSFAVKDEITPIQDFYNPIPAFVGYERMCFYAYFPNVLLDLAAALAVMVLVDSNKEVVGATGHISTRPVPR